MANPKTMISLLHTYAYRISKSHLEVENARQNAFNSLFNSLRDEEKQYLEEFRAFINKVDSYFTKKEMYIPLSILAGSFSSHGCSDERAKHLYDALDNPTPENFMKLIESAKAQDLKARGPIARVVYEEACIFSFATLLIVSILLAPIVLLLTLIVGSALSCVSENFKFYTAANLYIKMTDAFIDEIKLHSHLSEKHYGYATYDEDFQSATVLQGFFKSTAHRTTGGRITEEDKKNSLASENFMSPECTIK